MTEKRKKTKGKQIELRVERKTETGKEKNWKLQILNKITEEERRKNDEKQRKSNSKKISLKERKENGNKKNRK